MLCPSFCLLKLSGCALTGTSRQTSSPSSKPSHSATSPSRSLLSSWLLVVSALNSLVLIRTAHSLELGIYTSVLLGGQFSAKYLEAYLEACESHTTTIKFVAHALKKENRLLGLRNSLGRKCFGLPDLVGVGAEGAARGISRTSRRPFAPHRQDVHARDQRRGTCCARRTPSVDPGRPR